MNWLVTSGASTGPGCRTLLILPRPRFPAKRNFGSKHPSRDVIFSGQKMPKMISLHDVLEPLKQALLASRDVIISSQICGSNLQKVFTLGDGSWLPKTGPGRNDIRPPPPPPISGQKAFSRGGGWGCIFEAPRSRNFIPPPLLYPPPLGGYFQG